jgi:CHAD domain-containing protein
VSRPATEAGPDGPAGPVTELAPGFDHGRDPGGPDAPRAVEAELKYRMSDVAVGERLLTADELAGFRALGPVQEIHQLDRYLDTADGALARAGLGARLRESEEGAVVTVKALRRQDAGGALHRREELEGPAGPGLTVAEWPPTPVRALVMELVGEAALADLVTIRQLRHRRQYGYLAARVEVSADEVEVLDGERIVDRFAELEVEILEGADADVEPLASLLAEIEELVPAEGSKLERALDAVRRATGPATEGAGAGAGSEARRSVPKSPGVRADDHLAEAGRKVLRFHLARMIAREAGTRGGRDLEELHAMRVATRRQRAAWRVFGEAFDPKRTRRHRRELREVAGRLGVVRDLDVLIEAAEAYRDRQPAAEAAAFQPLLDRWHADRDAGRALLMRELDSSRYRSWVDDYRGFLATEGAGALPVGPTQPHRVRDTMPSRIWRAYEQVRAYEPVMRWADIETLHELRISAKWLRYTLEFVREALGRDAGPVIERIVALQDQLGWLHDADVAAGLARAFLVEHAGDLTEAQGAAIGRYLVDRERELVRLRRTMGPAWRGVASLAYRRALGRVCAGL